MLPLVSIVTPTYNRRRFIPSLIKIIQSQTYPRDRLEWIVYDDGQETIQDLLDAERSSLPKLTYIYSEDKMTLGEKRNRLNKEATGEIIVAMDDDDFYVPERVEYAVSVLQKSPSIDLVGSSKVYMYFTDIKQIYVIGPYFANHATNGTMAWRSRYAKTHTYDETVAFAEEKSFLDNFANPLVQLDCKKVMLVISHSDNTFDKTQLRTANNPLFKSTNLQIKEFIKDPALVAFFSSL